MTVASNSLVLHGDVGRLQFIPLPDGRLCIQIVGPITTATYNADRATVDLARRFLDEWASAQGPLP